MRDPRDELQDLDGLHEPLFDDAPELDEADVDVEMRQLLERVQAARFSGA